MKIRNGFVSNSSSSSFIIALDKKPKSPKEMYDMLFGRKLSNDIESDNIIEYCDYKLSKDKASEILFYDINKAKKLALKNINKDDYDYDLIRNFINRNKKKVIVQISYSDGDGESGCVMEHSGVVEELNCLRISHH